MSEPPLRCLGTGFAAALWRLKVSAQRCHRSAIRFHVALLVGSRVNFAIRWQSAACLRNSSDGFIDRSS